MKATQSILALGDGAASKRLDGSLPLSREDLDSTSGGCPTQECNRGGFSIGHRRSQRAGSCLTAGTPCMEAQDKRGGDCGRLRSQLRLIRTPIPGISQDSGQEDNSSCDRLEVDPGNSGFNGQLARDPLV